MIRRNRSWNIVRAAACLASGVGLALLSGCGGKPAGGGATAGSGAGSQAAGAEYRPAGGASTTFNYVQDGEPKRMDPAYSYRLYEGVVGGFMFDGLVNFGTGTDVQPGLAEKWEVSPDGKTYTFHLRPARFSDGTSVTAEDVRHSFTRILRPSTLSDRKWLLDSIAGADEVVSGKAKELSGLATPDDRTVVITLKKPYPAFLVKLAMPAGAIVPRALTSADGPSPLFEKNPVGTGPWVLDGWQHDIRLEFRPNLDYWGPKPSLNRLIYHVQTDDAIVRQQFQSGKFDIYPTVGFTVYGKWSKDPAMKDRLVPSPELNTYYLGFISKKPALKDKRVRQAIAHGIDTKAIFERLQLGRGTLAHGPVPAGIEGYRADVNPREFDPEKSKALLKEAGVIEPKLQLWVRTDNQFEEIAAAIQADLAKAGIRVEVNKRDQAAMDEAIYNGQPDLFLWSWWLDYPDIENALVPCFHSRNIPRQGNRAHFSEPAVDKLLDEAEATADPAARIAKFQEAEDAVIEECPWVPLFHRKSFSVTQPWVKGWTPSLMFNAARYTGVTLDAAKRK